MITTRANPVRELAEDAAGLWWMFLVTGVLWLWFALIVFRLNLDSVYAISIAFGVVAIASGVNELLAIPVSTSGWKIARGLLGAIMIAAGIVAFFRPTDTFVALASLVAWVLLFKGVFDVSVSLMNRAAELWWLLLIAGIAEIVIGFWAAGYFAGSALLLVVWVGTLALIRGITELLLGFRLRDMKKEFARVAPA